MWNIYQAFSESYDIKTYSSFFLYDDINIKFIPFKAFSFNRMNHQILLYMKIFESFD